MRMTSRRAQVGHAGQSDGRLHTVRNLADRLRRRPPCVSHRCGFVEAARIPPRLVRSDGRPLRPHGLPRAYARANPFNADSVDAARHSVREVPIRGAGDQVFATGGVFSATPAGQQQMTLAELTRRTTRRICGASGRRPTPAPRHRRRIRAGIDRHRTRLP